MKFTIASIRNLGSVFPKVDKVVLNASIGRHVQVAKFSAIFRDGFLRAKVVFELLYEEVPVGQPRGSVTAIGNFLLEVGVEPVERGSLEERPSKANSGLVCSEGFSSIVKMEIALH